MKQDGRLIFGALVNQVWSFADRGRFSFFRKVSAARVLHGRCAGLRA
jgi:hypothetical protein